MIREDFKHKQTVFLSDGLEYSFLRILTTDGSSAMILYRLMRWFARNRLLPLAYITQMLNKLLNQCVIGSGVEFGPGFVIMHPVGVIVNSRVRGQRRIVIESGVVIGSEKGNTPIIGNDVFIGSGAKVIGGVTVGDGAKIGANAVVVKDVAEQTTVVGIPAKPIARKKQVDQE